MSTSHSILIIDDEEIMRDVLSRLLTSEGYRVVACATGEEGLEKIERESIDLALLDLMLPGMGGMATLQKILEVDPDLVVVMISAYASIENAVAATKLGAFDFVTKPFQNEELALVIKNALKKRALEIENRHLKRTLRERYSFKNIIGKSEPMQKVYDLIAQVGPRRSTVLITGESGTGKELVAKAIHNSSPRASGPFVAVNSGTIPIELLESELFGHVKGAFTGAGTTKKGLFEIADGGTVFLDEVGTLPLETQTKLLRVIQEREFRRVGGLDNIKVDVRIIAATNSDLKKAVEQHLFREDLYYRLNVITIHLPPLRERREDIAPLVEHFTRRFVRENGSQECRFDSEAMMILTDHFWPGNVRELENAVERAVVLAPENGILTKDLLPREIVEPGPLYLGELQLLENGVSLKDLVHEFERNLITSALKQTQWNQKKAAQLLRVNATTLNEKLKRLDIKLP
ncbi:MAG: sigma-54-dependent Fis family transcriptional regulator [Acidobacteria bacterium]|nr:sigma-54-dependent Fis family transcriptional regulator [Acidobacteriota bacterium]